MKCAAIRICMRAYVTLCAIFMGLDNAVISEHMHIIHPPLYRPTSRPQRSLCGKYLNNYKTPILTCRASRLNTPKAEIQDFSAQLSWRTAFPFAELSGVFPNADAVEFEKRIYNFSLSTSRITVCPFLYDPGCNG